jgi:hypothetical protein
MRAFIGACVAALFLASCTLQNIQDPQFGLLDGHRVLPGLLKSIRCELITFYADNQERRRSLDWIRNRLYHEGVKTIRLDEVLNHRYYDLDTEAYGAFVLESKIVDNIGLPGTNSSFANQLHAFPAHAQVFTVAPTLSAQGTYDMNYNFAIQQDEDFAHLPHISEDRVPAQGVENGEEKNDPLLCYQKVVSGHFDDLAAGKYPTLERFDRLRVDGGLPLAAWLQYNTTIMGVSRNILADISSPNDRKPVPVAAEYVNEGVDGGQMSYIFTVQYTAGVDAKFSLLSSRWNTLAADLMASAVQTGVLSLYVNGYMAVTAINAKTGLVLIPGKGAIPQPQKVYVVNGHPNPTARGTYYPPVETEPFKPTVPGKEKPPGFRGEQPKEELKPLQAPRSAPNAPNRGIFPYGVAPQSSGPGP